MAKKDQTEPEATRVIRISAADATPNPTPGEAPAPDAKAAVVHPKKVRKNPLRRILAVLTWPFRAMGRYLAGSWRELRLVHWPTRGATWRMTGTLLAFTAFFAVIVLSIDLVFQYLFKLIIG